MYQPYPGGTRRADTRRPPAPASVRNAVKVMYVGAASSLIGIIIDLTTLSATKSALDKHAHHFMARHLSTQQHVHVPGVVPAAGFIAAGLIGAGLWIFVALWCQRGRNWARLTGTALFGLATLDTLTRVALPVTATRIYAVVVWLIGLTATVLLWQRSSSAFFRKAETRP